MTLRIGLVPSGLDAATIELVQSAEALGVDSIWVPEAWMYDALTPLGLFAGVTDRLRLASGVVQLGARTPAMLAMSALALQKMSGGRFVLGLGTSGPQVMEGWHGIRFDKPVTRTRETIEIIRRVFSGERVAYDGVVHQLPLPDSQGRSIRSPVATGTVPIHIAAMGPANLRLTGEMADGWIGTAFIAERAEAYFDPIREGATAAGRSMGEIELSAAVTLEFDDDAEAAARRHADGYAFTIGAMGSSATNFYNRAFERQGFGAEVAEVSRLWASGDRDAAAAAVPIELGAHTNLLGRDEDVLDRLRAYEQAGVSTLRVALGGPPDQRPDDLGRLMDLVTLVNNA